MISKVIPNYAKNIKKEYIFTIDINKKCEKFLNKMTKKMFLIPRKLKSLLFILINF